MYLHSLEGNCSCLPNCAEYILAQLKSEFSLHAVRLLKIFLQVYEQKCCAFVQCWVSDHEQTKAGLDF